MKKPAISIIMTVYNTEKYLNESIQSVVDQTFRDWELIIIDDGSTDLSPAIIDEWGRQDPRLRVVHKSQTGQADSRNTAIALAQGQYIGFVDSDDWIEPTMYEELYGLLQKEKADAALCAYTKEYKDCSVPVRLAPEIKPVMDKNEILRKLPQVDEVLKSKEMALIVENIPHDFLVNCIREVLVDTRANVLNGITKDIDEKEIIKSVINKVEKKSKHSLRRVINATGTVLHTNLGRAVVSKAATNAMIDVAYNYSNLEYDLKRGERGDRQSHIEKIITDLTGCEAAMVVNNNAAATVIVLASLAYEKEVIVSRGELIEIGGSFRIPDVMSESKAVLKEVGTTNKTKISDYKNNINENTAALMKVHTSNYRVVGFTEEATLNELVPLGNEYNLPVIYDMGNGLFVDLSDYGIDEPNVPNLVKEGADVILFSGDKLLGGPQAGIIIGKAKYINKMKKHPLARAFRVDKFTIAALTSTLFEYYDIKRAKKNIPILNMITMSKDELKAKAENIASLIKSKIKSKAEIGIEEIKDQVGGGTAPDVYLDGCAVSIISKDKITEKIERELRNVDVPVIVRVAHDKILIDVRTILEDDIELLVNEIASVI